MSHHNKHRHTENNQRFLKGPGNSGWKDGFDRKQLKRSTAKRRRADDQDHIDEQLTETCALCGSVGLLDEYDLCATCSASMDLLEGCLCD